MMTALAVFLAACGGGAPGGDTASSISVLNLKVYPNATNATLIWNNPDADIANISISYKNSTAVNFEGPVSIRKNNRIRPNVTVTEEITGLATGSIYTFRVALKLEGADENRSTSAIEITRLIGPNLDQDEYADADSRELDEDGDGTNDNLDAFPRNANLFAFTVTELTATPGNRVTLSWNNPDAKIRSISISYKRTGTNDSPTKLSITESTKIAPNAQNVEKIIPRLSGGQSYTFNVSLVLTGADAGKEVAAQSITAIPYSFWGLFRWK